GLRIRRSRRRTGREQQRLQVEGETRPGGRLPPGEHADRQPAVGPVGVTAAVFPLPARVKPVYPNHLHESPGLPHVVLGFVPLAVHVVADVVRGLARRVTEADPGVEGGGPDPERVSRLVYFRRAPEADVMAPPRVVAHGLLERQVLLAAPEEKAADRGVG